MAKTIEEQKRKRVLVVGAGAAGMSCAETLSNHPEKFDVTLVEAVDYCGGQAFSIPISKEETSASWLNQGVQGGSYIYHHSMFAFSLSGYQADPVELQVSFGKGEQFWTNMFPTQLLKRHAGEVKRFYYVLKLVRWAGILAILPIKWLVAVFFSKEFANLVALPMIALFLGTGNYTPDVPSIILERIASSPTFGMWYPPSKTTVVENIPKMVVFPPFSEFYNAWKERLIGKGVNVRLSTEVTRVVKRDKRGVVVKIIKRTPVQQGHNPNSAWVPDDIEGSKADADAVEITEEYDELVLTVLADTAKRLLEPVSTWNERRILGTAVFSDDLTVTHQDYEYIEKYYQPHFDEKLAVADLGPNAAERVARGRKDFRPMYFIRPYPQELDKLELTFDCTNYQSQFAPDVPFQKHVFQTIFLNSKRDGHLWPTEINEDKVIRKDWWHQLAHKWTLYVGLVPFMWMIQHRSSTHTTFAGSWNLINAHEVAIISGTAAAVALGADYPDVLERDRFAFLAFRCFYLLNFGKWYRRRATKHSLEGEGADWGQGKDTYYSTYRGPGCNWETERLLWQKEVEAGRSLKSLD